MAAHQLEFTPAFEEQEAAYERAMKNARKLEEHVLKCGLSKWHNKVLQAAIKEGTKAGAFTAWEVSHGEIARLIGCSVRTVSDLIDELQGWHLLDKTRLPRAKKLTYVFRWFNVWALEVIEDRANPFDELVNRLRSATAQQVASPLQSGLQSPLQSTLQDGLQSPLLVSRNTVHEHETRDSGFRVFPWQMEDIEFRRLVKSRDAEDWLFIQELWTEAIGQTWVVESEQNRLAFFGACHAAVTNPKVKTAVAVVKSRMHKKQLAGRYGTPDPSMTWARAVIRRLDFGEEPERVGDIDDQVPAEPAGPSRDEQIAGLKAMEGAGQQKAPRPTARPSTQPQTDWKALRAEFGPRIDAATLEELLALPLPDVARERLCQPNGDEPDSRRSELIRPTLLLAFQQREQQAATPDSEPSELENVTT